MGDRDNGGAVPTDLLAQVTYEVHQLVDLRQCEGFGGRSMPLDLDLEARFTQTQLRPCAQVQPFL